MAISLILFLLLIIFAFWVLKVSDWKVSMGLYVMLALDFLIILAISITRPFDFGGNDANNLILYGIYLATSGALFSVPVSVHKDEIFSGNMPKVVKNVLTVYLVYSAVLLILVAIEAYRLR